MTIECGDLLMRNSVAMLVVGAEAEIDGVLTTLTGVDDDYTVECVGSVLLASDRSPVDGAEEIAMTYTTPGRWRGVIPHTLELEEDTHYIVRAVMTVDGVGVGDWECEKIAKPRSCSRRC
jgi:hypothetical protein